MIISFFSYNLKIALESILQNKLRASLTSLGIIFGVSSVIAMLAIGQGAQEEILEKMKLLGTNNIIIKAKEQLEKKDQSEQEKKDEETKEKEKLKGRYSPGLTLADANSILNFIPQVSKVSPELILDVLAIRQGLKRETKLVGVSPDYFQINQFEFAEGGNFNDISFNNSASICVIGYGIRTKLFSGVDPIGQSIKCGNHWFKVVGVLKEKNISKENIQNLGIRNYNFDVYIPITTMMMRFGMLNALTRADLRGGSFYGSGGGIVIDIAERGETPKINQLDKIVVMLKDNSQIQSISEIIGRMLYRRHNQNKDFELIVPEQLLEQEKKTRDIFNIVLGAIASISLIVGGIGIMNIMLASVLERTKEIGIRRAVGAKRKDILLQFLIEAVTLSFFGGIIGIIFGFVLSFAIQEISGIKTIISLYSIMLSFAVSISIGLIFGITPARRASRQDPIELLRYE